MKYPSGPGPSVLFTGAEPDSATAVEVLGAAGVDFRSWDDGEDETPVLMNAWGVFPGIVAIRWVVKVMAIRQAATEGREP